jgi:hypothetical protein
LIWYSSATGTNSKSVGTATYLTKTGGISMIKITPQQKLAASLFILGLLVSLAAFPVVAQNLGTAPQVNVAVQGQTGAQPEGAFLNFVNWVCNVIAPVGAGVAVLGGIVSYAAGHSFVRYGLVGLGLLAVSGIIRLLEFWILQGTGGVS